MSGGGGQTSNTVSQFKPPDYTQQPWQDYVSGATGLSAQGLPIYTGQTVAPMSQQAQIGSGMLTSLATQGSPLYDTAQTNLQGTLQGDFMNPFATQVNPFIGNNPAMQQYLSQSNQQLAQNYARGTAAQTDAAAARAGAYGGSGWQEAQDRNAQGLANQIEQNTNNLLGQNYAQSANLMQGNMQSAAQAVEAERNRQIQAAGMAPGYQSADINAIQAMTGAGDAQQNYQQNLLNAAQSLFGQYAMAPHQLQDLLGSALSRASGQGGTTTSQIYGPQFNPMQGLLGAGAIGAGLFGGG